MHWVHCILNFFIAKAWYLFKAWRSSNFEFIFFDQHVCFAVGNKQFRNISVKLEFFAKASSRIEFQCTTILIDLLELFPSVDEVPTFEKTRLYFDKMLLQATNWKSHYHETDELINNLFGCDTILVCTTIIKEAPSSIVIPEHRLEKLCTACSYLTSFRCCYTLYLAGFGDQPLVLPS